VTTPTPDQSGEAADVPQDGPVTTEPGAEVVPARIVHEARPKEVPLTRRPMARWDRVKFLLLIFLLFWFFVWAEYADANPFNTFGDALRDTFETKWFLELLFVAEALRQVHYLISEHSKRYHRFWTKSVFGRFERRTGRMNDYTRFRMSRAFKVLIAIVIISIIAVVNVADALRSASGAEATALAVQANSLVDTYDWAFQWGPGLVAGIGNGLMLGYLIYRSALVPPRMALLGLIGGPVLILSFVLKLCDVYEDGSALAGLLTLPEAAWELSLGIYCAWKGFRLESPIARQEMAMVD